MEYLIVAAVILCIAAIFANSDSSSDAPGDSFPSCQNPGATPPSHFESSQHWEKNHFIHKHLHRDDAKHARHKRNQTPW